MEDDACKGVFQVGGKPPEEKSCQLIYVAAEARDQTGGEVSIQSQDITNPPRGLHLTQERGTGKW